MSVIQVLLLIFAVFGFAAAVSKYRRGGIAFRQLVLWMFLWLAVAVVVLWPNAASFVAHRLGVGRGTDVVVYLAMMAVFYLLFRVLARLEDHERHLTQLARELALKDLEKPHERS